MWPEPPSGAGSSGLGDRILPNGKLHSLSAVARLGRESIERKSRLLACGQGVADWTAASIRCFQRAVFSMMILFGFARSRFRALAEPSIHGSQDDEIDKVSIALISFPHDLALEDPEVGAVGRASRHPAALAVRRYRPREWSGPPGSGYATRRARPSLQRHSRISSTGSLPV